MTHYLTRELKQPCMRRVRIKGQLNSPLKYVQEDSLKFRHFSLQIYKTEQRKIFENLLTCLPVE